MEYLIKFGGKKLSLSRTDIANLYPVLEPYFLSIMQGLDETTTIQFVNEYNGFVKNLSKNRMNPVLTKPVESVSIKESNGAVNKESAEIIDLTTRKRLNDQHN